MSLTDEYETKVNEGLSPSVRTLNRLAKVGSRYEASERYFTSKDEGIYSLDNLDKLPQPDLSR